MNRRNLLAAALGLPLAPLAAIAAPASALQVWGTALLPPMVWRHCPYRFEVVGDGQSITTRRVWENGTLVYDSASGMPPEKILKKDE